MFNNPAKYFTLPVINFYYTFVPEKYVFAFKNFFLRFPFKMMGKFRWKWKSYFLANYFSQRIFGLLFMRWKLFHLLGCPARFFIMIIRKLDFLVFCWVINFGSIWGKFFGELLKARFVLIMGEVWSNKLM